MGPEEVQQLETALINENEDFRFEEAGLEVVRDEKARMAQMADWAHYAWADEDEDQEVEMARRADGLERAEKNKIAAKAIRAAKEKEMKTIR